MAKSMPLPPADPGFAGVVSKLPETGPLRDRYSPSKGGAFPQTRDMPPTIESEALLQNWPSEETTLPAQNAVSEVDLPLDFIDVSPYQPRIKFDEDGLRRLADSIQADQQINPIVVRKRADGRYELIGGERRLRAFQLLRRTHIRAVVKSLSDADAEIMALTDNEARDNLTDYERAKRFKSLLDRKVVLNQSDLSRRIGVERTMIAKCLTFFRFPPEALDLLEKQPGLIGAGNASVFTTAMEANDGKDSDLVIAAIQKVYDKKLDVANAINWLKGQIRRRYSPKATPLSKEWTEDGRKIASIKADGRKLVFSCADGIDPSDLLDQILAAKLSLPKH